MKRKKICGIYKIKNLTDGKVYIGQTVDFERRVSEYRTRKASGMKSSLYRIMEIIEKEGFDNFSMEMIYECPKEELNRQEMKFINIYESYKPEKGYNSFHLDENGKLSVNQLTRDKMRITHTGLKESANTKRKKSNKIIALDEFMGIIVIADSAKLFADIIGSKKDIIKNCLRNPSMINGYYIYYYDKDKRNEILNKVMSKTSGFKDYLYLIYGEYLNRESVETIESEFVVIPVTYELFE